MASSVMRTFVRRMSTKKEIEHITVIGGGLMGAGIAQVAAASGYKVSLVELNQEVLAKSQNNIKKGLLRAGRRRFKDNEDAQQKYAESIFKQIEGTSDLKDGVKKTDFVIEAIVENLQKKHELFEQIEKLAPEHAIMTSNTSSLSITDIAQASKRKDRFAGMHFFHPVQVMKLLEVVRLPDTTDDTHKTVLAVGESMGKTCITCKDTPGFVVNRLLVPYLAEAIRMLERGDASARDIDTAMKLGAGHPMGPIELADYIGLDTQRFILHGWNEKYPDNPLFKPIKLVEKLSDEKKFGRKSGEGFYKYSNH
ncbi:hydroxyacyl-coenzyme A dehydrogenase, mitochondrial-like [Condylostylus longicornis]|uniref:hydroxyacyl-coenzyme A dehydrogenase, mitochondrial-like n=1 Tax=Condylostylus longicornis TaxID=2530218 RepID=UPI00244E2734|nr:hydroxyacyl-coenzyme A dehydrogenase, mitochondrial-like [Condylostylus longicornis]